MRIYFTPSIGEHGLPVVYKQLGTDLEMDIIAMAVYGDVIHSGNQCRRRSVAEMLGKFKSKDDMAACKLPNNKSLWQTEYGVLPRLKAYNKQN